MKQMIDLFYRGTVTIDFDDRAEFEKIMKNFRVKGVYRKVLTQSVVSTSDDRELGISTNNLKNDIIAKKELINNIQQKNNSLEGRGSALMNGNSVSSASVKQLHNSSLAPANPVSGIKYLPAGLTVKKLSQVNGHHAVPKQNSNTNTPLVLSNNGRQSDLNENKNGFGDSNGHANGNSDPNDVSSQQIQNGNIHQDDGAMNGFDSNQNLINNDATITSKNNVEMEIDSNNNEDNQDSL